MENAELFILVFSQKYWIVDNSITMNRMSSHQALEIPACPLHGGKRKDEFPSNVNESVQYDENLQALVVAFNTVKRCQAEKYSHDKVKNESFRLLQK